MSDGSMIQELREILSGEQAISTKAAQRLMLTGMLELYRAMDLMTTSNLEIQHTLEQVVTASKKCEDVEAIKQNWAVMFGQFVKAHPRLMTFLATMGFLMLNLWFIPAIRRGILTWIGLPADLVAFLAP